VGVAYSKPWGMKKDVIYSSLSKYKDQELKFNGTETVGNMVWYRGILDGKTLWIDSSRLAQKEERTTSRLGQIKDGSVKIYKTIGNPTSAIQAGTSYTNRVLPDIQG
jgi:hypothetical protein